MNQERYRETVKKLEVIFNIRSEWTPMRQTDLAVVNVTGATDCFNKLVRSPEGRSSFAGTLLKGSRA